MGARWGRDMAWRRVGRKRALDAASFELRLRPQDRAGGPPTGRTGRRRDDETPRESRRRRRRNKNRKQKKQEKTAPRIGRLIYWGVVLALWAVDRRDRHAGLGRHPSSADPVARNPQAPALGPHPWRQRRNARHARRHGRRRGAAARVAGLCAEGVHRHRGSPLLFASRRRSHGEFCAPSSPTCCAAAPRKADRPSPSSSPRICS